MGFELQFTIGFPSFVEVAQVQVLCPAPVLMTFDLSLKQIQETHSFSVGVFVCDWSCSPKFRSIRPPSIIHKQLGFLESTNQTKRSFSCLSVYKRAIFKEDKDHALSGFLQSSAFSGLAECFRCLYCFNSPEI